MQLVAIGWMVVPQIIKGAILTLHIYLINDLSKT